MCVSEVLSSLRVTVAWKLTDDCRQFPLSRHVFFCRQLHDSLSTVLSVVSSVLLGNSTNTAFLLNTTFNAHKTSIYNLLTSERNYNTFDLRASKMRTRACDLQS